MKKINRKIIVIFLFNGLNADSIYIRPANYDLILSFFSGFAMGAINGSIECKKFKNRASLLATTLVINDLIIQRKIALRESAFNINIIENKRFKEADTFFWYSSPIQAIISIGAYGLGNLFGMFIKNMRKEKE